MSRRRRDGSLSEAQTAALRAEFLADIVNLYLPTPMSDSIIDGVVALSDLHVLRASDAVQFSTALDINAKLITAGRLALSLVSSDQAQIKAALAEVPAVVDPTSMTP